MPPSSDINHLRWLCRRGMRETDLLLGGYLDRCYNGASPGMQASFRAMLEEPDQDILDWVMQRRRCPPQYEKLIGELRQLSGVRKPGSN